MARRPASEVLTMCLLFFPSPKQSKWQHNTPPYLVSPESYQDQHIFQNPSDASWTSPRKTATTLDHNSPWQHPLTNIYRTSMEGSPDPQLVSAVRHGYREAAADVALSKSRCELHEEKISRETKLQIHKIRATRADQKQKVIGEIILNNEVIERRERELAAAHARLETARQTTKQLTEDVSRIEAGEEEDTREIKRKNDERDKLFADLKERHQTYEVFRYHKLVDPNAFSPSMISPPSPGDQISSDLAEQGWEKEHGQDLEPEAAIAADTDGQRQEVEQTGSHQHGNAAAAAAAASPDWQMVGQAQTQGTETCQRQKRPTRDSGGPGPATPRPRKRARRLVEQALHVTSTISFDEVFQGGHPSNKFEIVEPPRPDGTWYILHCKEHKLCFGGNGKQAAAAAAKHLGSDAHGGTGTFVQHFLAFNQFGIEVYDCDAEKAEKNNSMVKRSCADAGAFQGTINPTAGQPYITAYAGSRWVVMVLPTDNFAKVGVRGTFDSCKLARRIPKCYTRRSVDGWLGWAEGFEDGGPKVQERRFPVRYFNEEEDVDWVSAEALKSCDLDDLDKCRGVCGAEAARKFYPRLEFYQRLAAEPDSGSDDSDDDTNHPGFDADGGSMVTTNSGADITTTSYQPHGLPIVDNAPHLGAITYFSRVLGESEQERRLPAFLHPQEPGVAEQQSTYPHTNFSLGPSQRSPDRAGVGAAPVAPMTTPLAGNATPGVEYGGDLPANQAANMPETSGRNGSRPFWESWNGSMGSS